MEAMFASYAEALAREMELAGSLAVKTVYIGGGTPTVLPPYLISRLVAAAHSVFNLEAAGEWSIEANPGTLDSEMLTSLLSTGFTRLSLGVQSFDDGELRLLGRIHSGSEALEAFSAARSAGFEQVNLDLIYGLPGQPLSAWKRSLDTVLALHPDHLSLYALTLEEGTPLAAAVADRRVPEPDPDQAADMYELAEQRLAADGYLHYEISNWAASPAARCQHNLIYWRNEPYLGLGAGAHSWMGGQRRANLTSPTEYVARMRAGQDTMESEEWIGPDLGMGETMMLGLRLLQEGVAYERFQQRFGTDLRLHFAGEIMELEALGLIMADSQRVRLTQRGRLLGNQAFMRFLPG
jgi:oxygen-independent coproporphyrinogen-3 oxidase